MSKRFGRNQRRKLMERLQEAEGDASFANDALCATRRWADEGLGFNCTFVDDDMRVIVGLAQRAVLRAWHQILTTTCSDGSLKRRKSTGLTMRGLWADR